MVVKYTFSVDKVFGFETKAYHFLCDPELCDLELVVILSGPQYLIYEL